MLWVPPESITSASPRRMISTASPIACELAAQAVRQLALGPRAPKRLARWPAGVPGSCSASGVRCNCSPARLGNQAPAREPGRVDLPVAIALVHQADEPGEVLLPLARAEVDAEPGPVEPGVVLLARVVDRHPRRGDGELRVAAALLPAPRVVDVVL